MIRRLQNPLIQRPSILRSIDTRRFCVSECTWGVIQVDIPAGNSCNELTP